MPVISGLKTTRILKEKFENVNKRVEEREDSKENGEGAGYSIMNETKPFILRPFICYLT